MDYFSPQTFRGYQAPGRERLERLAAYLDTVPHGLLTLTRWYGAGKGCAVGLAARNDAWFQAQGLRLEAGENSRTRYPAFEDLSDWPAVAKFFDLSHEEAQSLFSPYGYDGCVRPEPADMAGRIRAHLAARVEAAA